MQRGDESGPGAFTPRSGPPLPWREHRGVAARRGLALLAAVLLTVSGFLWLRDGGGGADQGLVYRVTPVDDGIHVTVEIRQEPAAAAWVGFGVGPGSPAGAVDRVVDLRARAADGRALPVRVLGEAAWEIDLGSRAHWELSYRVAWNASPGRTFYRASHRGPDHVLLIGSDVWARFYPSAAALERDPEHRALGGPRRAAVSFDLERSPDSWVAVGPAGAVGRSSGGARFPVDGELAYTVFALGPYEVDRVAEGLAIAVHERWTAARRELGEMTAALFGAMVEVLGSPPQDRAVVALYSPLPRDLQPREGMATAGMTRGRNLLIFAATADGLSPDTARVRQNLALLVAHEMFHLYVPWGVPVAAELSWFSEGWATHMARRVGVAAGYLDEAAAQRRLGETYRDYIALGGFRAGSLPEASSSLDDSEDLLYRRGELVFRYLDREWRARGEARSFDAVLWDKLQRQYDGHTPLTAGHVRAALVTMVRPETIRRYVEGTAPLTREDLGLR